MAKKIDLWAIVGPTASGKTALGIELAKRNHGEVIAADSRTVYQDMDIGTAKPTDAEQKQVKHWGIDLVTPSEPYSAMLFQKYAHKTIADIRTRGKTPILVGGTGLYIDAVLYQYSFVPVDVGRRAELERLSSEQLRQQLAQLKLPLPQNSQNKLHLINAILRAGQLPTKQQLPATTQIIGLCPSRDILRKRIELRAEAMVAQGVVEETKWLAKQYGWDSPAMSGGIYKALRPYIEGRAPLQQAIDLFITSDMNLAKRQITWFRRNGSDVKWFENSDQAMAWLQEYAVN